MKVDFRLIVAGNKNLLTRIDEKLFREDLYYRMNEFPIFLPPVRERVEDIEELLKFFLGEACTELGIKQLSLSEECIIQLKKYSWPGNVRELKNAVKRVAITCSNHSIIEPECFDFLHGRKLQVGNSLEQSILTLKDAVINKELELTDIEDRVVEQILKEFNNSVGDAVEKTGIQKTASIKLNK